MTHLTVSLEPWNDSGTDRRKQKKGKTHLGLGSQKAENKTLHYAVVLNVSDNVNYLNT